MKPENQPTPPEGHEILAPEIAGMMPQGMKYGDRNNDAEEYTWYNMIPIACKFEESWMFKRGCPFIAPLGTTAMLTTPGPEAKCSCDQTDGYMGPPVNILGKHSKSCPAHPRNAYVKVLPGWVEKHQPSGIICRWREGYQGNQNWAPWKGHFTTLSCLDVDTVFAIPCHVYDAIEAGRKVPTAAIIEPNPFPESVAGSPTDGEMLDWLEKQDVLDLVWFNGKDVTSLTMDPRELAFIHAPTLRAAIAAAMKAQ